MRVDLERRLIMRGLQCLRKRRAGLTAEAPRGTLLPEELRGQPRLFDSPPIGPPPLSLRPFPATLSGTASAETPCAQHLYKEAPP